MFILSWMKFISSWILRGVANILRGAADMAYNGKKNGLPIIHGCYGAQRNQHDEADTTWHKMRHNLTKPIYTMGTLGLLEDRWNQNESLSTRRKIFT